MSDTFAFNVDLQQMLNVIFNPLYSNREIFLRELISNASDALVKIRDKFDLAKLEAQPELVIHIIPVWTNNTLTIEDSGIGMTKNELITFLGSFGRSSSRDFYEFREAGCDTSLIGRFGIGFYSVFCVSDKVRVISKNHDDEQFIWESEAGGPFTVRKDTEMVHGEIKRGTKVICFLKRDMSEFLEIRRLKDLAKKHSESIVFPIKFGSLQSSAVRGKKRSAEGAPVLMDD